MTEKTCIFILGESTALLQGKWHIGGLVNDDKDVISSIVEAKGYDYCIEINKSTDLKDKFNNTIQQQVLAICPYHHSIHHISCPT